MTFVVTGNRIKCIYTGCVEVRPVDCLHEGPNFPAIDPDKSIDCALCEPECPAGAILADDDAPQDQMACIALNAGLCADWPMITQRRDPPGDAAACGGKPGKPDPLKR